MDRFMIKKNMLLERRIKLNQQKRP